VPDRILYLIRHGHYDHQNGGGLSDIGRQQALASARWLRSLNVSSIHCSTLKRAEETAAIISKEFAVTAKATDLLRELPNTLWQALPQELTAETLEAHRQRAAQAFFEFCHAPGAVERTEIIVSHGNMIRYFACKAIGVAPELWTSFGTYNCGISELRITSGGRVRMFSYNETAHLPEGLKTEGTMKLPAEP
jgi:broad specificity phosphatase PhoE